MIKVGFNVLAWTAEVSEKLFPIADRLKKIGYDGVECFIGAGDAAAYRQFGNHARALGLETTAVTVMSKETNPVDGSAAVRAKSLDQIKWVIDRTHDMQASGALRTLSFCTCKFLPQCSSRARISMECRSASCGWRLRSASEYYFGFRSA